MDISARHARDNTRHVHEMHGAAVGAAALAHALLCAQSRSLGGIQHKALIARVRDHAAVKMPEHRAAMKRRLHLVGRQEGVVRRTALEHVRNIGIKRPHRCRHTALPHFLLGRNGRHYVNGKIVARSKLAQGDQHRCHARAAVERLSNRNAALSVEGKLRCHNKRLADAQEEALARLLGTRRTHVENHLGRYMSGLLGSACKMRRFDANGAVQPFAAGVAHQHVLAAKGPFGETPQRHESHGSVCANGTHHAAHFIAMGVHHHARTGTLAVKLHAMRHDQAIAQRVFFHLGPAVAKVTHDVDDFVLKTRRALGVREALE